MKRDKYFFYLILEHLVLVSRYNAFIVIEVSFSGFEVNIDIVYDMIFPSEPLFVQNYYCLLLCHDSLLYINWNLQV